MPFPPPAGLGGPKPQGLAGPQADADVGEQLPWLIDPNNPPAPAPGAQAKPVEKHKSTKKKTPAKTIGSRGTSGQKAKPSGTPAKIPDAKPNDVAVAHPQSAAPEQSPAGANGNGIPEAKAAPKDDDAGADQTPILPTFRIAPEASRLGGPIPADPSAAAKSPSSPSDTPCRVLSASYGGTKTLLVRSTADGETRYTALTVLDGFEKSMFDTYTKSKAPGAEIVGEYPSRDDALADARVNCPGG